MSIRQTRYCHNQQHPVHIQPAQAKPTKHLTRRRRNGREARRLCRLRHVRTRRFDLQPRRLRPSLLAGGEAQHSEIDQELEQFHQRHEGHADEEAEVAAHVADEGVPLQGRAEGGGLCLG